MSDLIKMVQDENAVDFKTEIENRLNTQLRTALDAKRDEVSSTFFQPEQENQDE